MLQSQSRNFEEETAQIKLEMTQLANEASNLRKQLDFLNKSMKRDLEELVVSGIF